MPLSVCHTLVDYVLSPHATNLPPTENDISKRKVDERFSALDVCSLLDELHQRCHGLLEKYSTVTQNEGVNHNETNGIDVWCDVWKPILISLARCSQSKHPLVVKEIVNILQNALLSQKHGQFLTGSQWVQVQEELLFPLVTSICQMSAAARAQATLGTSPTKGEGNLAMTGDLSNNGCHALTMLVKVIVKRSVVMKREQKNDFLTVWSTAIRTIMDFSRSSSSSNKLSSDGVHLLQQMVGGMKDQYDAELETLTRSTVGSVEYDATMNKNTTTKIKKGVVNDDGIESSSGREVKESPPPPPL